MSWPISARLPTKTPPARESKTLFSSSIRPTLAVKEDVISNDFQRGYVAVFYALPNGVLVDRLTKIGDIVSGDLLIPFLQALSAILYSIWYRLNMIRADNLVGTMPAKSCSTSIIMPPDGAI